MAKKATETLSFKVDAEWLCNFVRQRVWYEGLPFTDGVKALVASFSGIDTALATDILIGRKKLVGINCGEVVEDNKVNDYLAYVKRTEAKKIEESIEKDLLIHPYAYLDPFATRWSIKEFEKEQINFSTCTISTLREYFGRPPCDDDYLMQGGLYSIDTHFAHKKIESKEDQLEFYESLYKYWEKYLSENSASLTPKDVQQITIRQKTYELWKTKDERREKRLKKLIAEGKRFNRKITAFQKEEYNGAPRGLLPSWTIDGDGIFTLCEAGESYYQRQGKFKPLDDKIFYEYGIISPKGDFYACTFASHNACAYVIYTTILGHTLEDEDGFAAREEWNIAKDKLYDLGWCYVNTAWGVQAGNPFYSKWGALEDMPQRMMDTCYDWLVWNRNKKEN